MLKSFYMRFLDESLLKRIKSEGIDTAFDTCGMYSEESLKKILPFTNTVLFDLKEIDPVKHKEYTGSTNELILSNLKFINNFIEQKNCTYAILGQSC